MTDRHTDHGAPLARFAGAILVVCPRCGGRATVAQRPGLPELRYAMELLFRPRRLVCAGCGATDDWEAERRGSALIGVTLGGTEDPYFGRPLWLQVRCAGHVLWAYDADHVDALAAYVGARLRERGPASPTTAMVPRLPRWMTAADRRTEVLAALAALRAQAARTSPEDRSDVAHERADRPRPRRSSYHRGGPY
ncbi:hypothetical protein [Streptomyces longispororuber]|uniref:hypothetical protein n=1 Tax=Streptomyces longispororuber TaxID=68230 RepID=UPI00210B9639|nr:hypothetical protein [Streptomyces longispororuber]MCQ4206225.1 hypothetical protein [Streptomyces longispororuber]